jgi:hypothetical protein
LELGDLARHASEIGARRGFVDTGARRPTTRR